MSEGDWEPGPRRGRPWAAVPVVLALVVAAVLLVRPGAAPEADGDLEVLPGQVEADGVEETPTTDPTTPTGPSVAVVHALSTVGLGARVAPLELEIDGRELRSAVTSRGRQLLVLAINEPGDRFVTVQVRDASTLALVADLGRRAVRGQIELLGISPDGGSVVWLDPAREPGQGPVVHRVGTGGGITHRIQLPGAVAVRDVRPVTADRVAVLVERRGGEPGLAVFVVTGLSDPGDDGIRLEELPLGDVGEDVGPGAIDDGTPVPARAAHVWDDRQQLLHVVHAQAEALTTADLVDLTAEAGPVGVDLTGAGVVQRDARLTLDGSHIAVTGTLTRPDPARGLGRDAQVPLEPLVLTADRFASDRGAVRSRGEATAGERVLAAGVDRIALSQTSTALPRDRTASSVVVRDLDLARVGETVLVDGVVVGGAINHAGTHLLLVRDVVAGTLVSEHPITGGPRVERAFAHGSRVHLEAVVVIELR